MTTPQKRALKWYRKRLNERGMARFEVLERSADRELIRTARIRATIRQTVSGEPSPKGGILNALRRSPLVGAELDLSRPPIAGCRVDL